MSASKKSTCAILPEWAFTDSAARTSCSRRFVRSSIAVSYTHLSFISCRFLPLGWYWLLVTTIRTSGHNLTDVYKRQPRNGCNIAPGTDPAPEAATEDFRNFGQRFSAADFSHRQMGASCTFVCRKTFRHTKGARSARLGGVPESRHLNYQIDDNHEKEDRTPDNDRSQSPQV